MAGTVILHGMAVHALLPGSTIHKTKPPDLEGGGGSAPPAAELVLIQSLNEPRAEDDPFVSLSMHLPAADLLPVSLDRLPTPNIPKINDGDAESAALTPAVSGDPAIATLMYGRYTGQISARIERVWIRPQSPVTGSGTESPSGAIAGDLFRCVVQIRQDDKGNVQEVLLIDCNGTEAWRHSLVVAINQSSPLPAPPIPSVFKRALTMTFEGRSSENGETLDAAGPARSDQQPITRAILK
ncbi:MAG: TonB C-terminal domain-containing protein [Steroidobacteraceae bacterium]